MERGRGARLSIFDPSRDPSLTLTKFCSSQHCPGNKEILQTTGRISVHSAVTVSQEGGTRLKLCTERATVALLSLLLLSKDVSVTLMKEFVQVCPSWVHMCILYPHAFCCRTRKCTKTRRTLSYSHVDHVWQVHGMSDAVTSW